MTPTGTPPSLHHDGQFAIRLATQQRIAPEATSWLATNEPEMRKKSKPSTAPRHPIPSMQEAFAESLEEVNSGASAHKPNLRTDDAKRRRELLLDQDKSEGPPAAVWRYRPGQKCHELRKLMAQISFGVYLLLQGLANSNAQVVSILQGHIDEVDEFLEVNMEDFKLATEDLTKRMDYLKIPMDNVMVFEQMLEDRTFRLQIVEGNVKIEHILSRTTTALVQSVQDISEGLKSTKEFTVYLAEQQHESWRRDRPDVIDIFEAMRGNTEGWLNAFVDLQAKSNTLNALVVKLNGMVAEMDKRAGEVSRRTRFSIRPFTSPTDRPRNSQSSSEATPPASPVPKIAASPPRLSLRFSSLPVDGSSGPTYFDLPTRDTLVIRDTLPAFQYTPVQTPDTRKEAEVNGDQAPVPESQSDAEPEFGAELKPERVAESRNSGDSEDETQPDSPLGDGPLYILQPRTYTPLPPAPLPSPRIIEEPKPTKSDVPRLQQDTEIVNVVLPPIQEKSKLRRLSSPRVQEEPKAVRRVSSRITDEPRSPIQAAVRAQEESLEQDLGAEKPKKRTSLRDRVSLKTSPPQSIQVPPLNALELQRPVFASPKTYQNYRTFIGPDSAYGSDADRTAVNSVADPPTATFSPPVFPGIIPSPHSDQQHFRPVRASPHSPLQQRPHTAGNVTHRPSHQRNAPSAMGMSMLSTVTTLDPNVPGGRKLKKKRSAFAWLKKAFTLDEEERALFDQRKQEQARNLYYDGRSPRYLDGKRIR